MPVHLLRDADIKAISLVDKAANRKRFFLYKAAGDEETEQISTGRIVKAEGWETVYAVVAEPGWHENPGQGAADPDVDDRWADEDEIRKAAHRFMANKGLVTKMHESMEPYGVIVENAIAHVDFTVGAEVIKQGSWYVAIQPTPEGREAIDKGEFTGVSIEGHAVRELVEKDAALVPNKPGKTNWVQEAGGLPKFIGDIAGDLISEKGKSTSNAIQMAVGIVRNWAEGKGKVTAKTRAKAAAALAEWEAKKAAAHVSKAVQDEVALLAADPEFIAKVEGSATPSRTVDHVEKSLLQKIAEKVGLAPEDIEKAELTPEEQKVFDKLKAKGMSDKQAMAMSRQSLKKAQTFGELMAQREFDDALPEAFNAFRSAVSYAFFPPLGETPDPVALISESCDEFKTWALGMLDSVPVQKAERAEALGVELTPEGSVNDSSTKDGEMTLTDSERAEFDGLKKQVEDLPGKVTAELAKALGGKVDDADPTPESIAKAIKDLNGVEDESEIKSRMEKIEADIAKLAAGDSTQTPTVDEPSKEESAEAVRKAFKDADLSADLAGVL